VALSVREMRLDEVGLIIDYFHGSTAEHLELLGVDPTRLPSPGRWHELFARQFEEPVRQRSLLPVTWEDDGASVGFSTADKIRYGDEAHMHLHVVDPGRRASGLGAECVRRTVDLFFERLQLRRLFCEPNAFNVAPNRTLQQAGFKYVKTHMTVPGPLNFHQPVTRWVMERDARPAEHEARPAFWQCA
jgi:RimJ/RimL family protein N-acetyltransferase